MIKGLMMGIIIAVIGAFLSWKMGRKAKKLEENIGSDGYTRLIWASWCGDVALVKSLLAEGADVNAKDSLGQTALMHACDPADNGNVIVALLEEGADASIKSNKGRAALEIAKSKGHKEQVKILTGGKLNTASGFFFMAMAGLGMITFGGLGMAIVLFDDHPNLSGLWTLLWTLICLVLIGAGGYIVWSGSSASAKVEAKNLGIKSDFIK